MNKKVISFASVILLVMSLFLIPIIKTNITADKKVITDNLNASNIPDHITLTWSDDPSTTQTITWRTSSDVKKCYISYKKSMDFADSSMFTVEGIKFPSIDESKSGNMNIFTITLKGLEPGTKYSYNIKTDSYTSNQHTFTTEEKDTDEYKALIFGDSQSGTFNTPNYTPWHDTLQAAFKENKDAKFMINMGDLVEVGQSLDHWNSWYAASKGVIDTIPIMPIQGNHETFTVQGDSTKPSYFISQFNLFQNGPEGLKGQVYSYDYGNAHFAVLDSQESEESPKYGDILKSQAEWLEKDLSSTKKLWKFVLIHKPPYYNYTTRPNEDIKSTFCPIFDKYHVDVAFSAHDHCIARTYPINNDSAVLTPKDGTIYYITGRSGAKYYSGLSRMPWNTFFYDPQDKPCYLTLQVNKDKITITAKKQDGVLLNEYTIDKSKQ